ncbi:hypothetical protein Lepto7375DRAFT_5213 [Leptolyngbya sp. PCC 7375]|nr:hypothetical protein Lepto7375DRAFT_5213 [Leptolyngbya sp. PCC 7375]
MLTGITFQGEPSQKLSVRGSKVFVDTAAWLALVNQDDDLPIRFVVMQQEGVSVAFTSDRHFEQAGFQWLLNPA